MRIKLLQNFIDILRHKKKYGSFIDKLSNNMPIGDSFIIAQKTLFLGLGKIKLCENSQIGYYPSPDFHTTESYIEARNKTAFISIGKSTMINIHCRLICNSSFIEIGDNCRIGTDFLCVDSDFHGIKKEDRDNPEKIKNRPVKIGNDVFIGNNVTILKGVEIGDNCVIGAGSVVVKSIPANTVACGNPAKVIKEIR